MPVSRNLCIFLNVGLGEGSALPVGVPVPWPSATPPTGWMKCNGSSFNLTSYPALAAVFPSGVLPDLRGEFIRGWDDGRGVDTGRVLLSSQGDAIRNITAGNIRVMRTGENNTAPTGAFSSAADNLVTGVGPGDLCRFILLVLMLLVSYQQQMKIVHVTSPLTIL